MTPPCANPSKRKSATFSASVSVGVSLSTSNFQERRRYARAAGTARASTNAVVSPSVKSSAVGGVKYLPLCQVPSEKGEKTTGERAGGFPPGHRRGGGRSFVFLAEYSSTDLSLDVTFLLNKREAAMEQIKT